VYVDGTSAWHADAAELAKRPTDYTRGALHGWKLWGGILPPADASRTQKIEVEAADGKKLAIDDPAANYPGLEPVLFPDRTGALRFMLVGTEASGQPHGRGAGNGRGGGGQRGKSGPLALDGVTIVRVTRAPEKAAGGDDQKSAFDLVIGGKRERLTLADVAKRVQATDAPGARGQVWPLRDLVGAKVAGDVQRVTIDGGRGDHYTIEKQEWRGDRRLYLRRNARGLAKFEANGGGEQRGDVPDVTRIDVKLR
jgi:hypothetical protein